MAGPGPRRQWNGDGGPCGRAWLNVTADHPKVLPRSARTHSGGSSTKARRFRPHHRPKHRACVCDASPECCQRRRATSKRAGLPRLQSPPPLSHMRRGSFRAKPGLETTKKSRRARARRVPGSREPIRSSHPGRPLFKRRRHRQLVARHQPAFTASGRCLHGTFLLPFSRTCRGASELLVSSSGLKKNGVDSLACRPIVSRSVSHSARNCGAYCARERPLTLATTQIFSEMCSTRTLETSDNAVAFRYHS